MRLTLALVLVCVCALAACASSPRTTVPLTTDARWAVLPLGADPLATREARSAGALVETRLRARGVRSVNAFGGTAADARDRARREGYRYAVAGGVDAWGYGGRLDSEPRVDLHLEVIDLATGSTVHAAEADLRGRRGSALPALAERAVAELIDGIALVDAGTNARPDAPRATPVLALRPAPDTARMPARSIAFHYGDDLPVAELALFDRTVVEPDHTSAAEIRALGRHGGAVYAYLSIGEVGPHRTWRDEIDDAWTLGTNAAWDSRVMDMTATGWTDFLLARVDALVEAGYAGLFLDTLDSHRLHAGTPALRAVQEAATVRLLREVAARHPDLRLVANRGFELLERVAPLLEAVAAESLYSSWNNAAGEYADVLPADRAWLTERLREASGLGLEAIAIDYVAPARRDEARAVARRIAADGFTPWVSVPALDHLGVGALEILPREVLMLYDSRADGLLQRALVHKLLATPLEYLGYVPRYHDVALAALPPGRLAGRVAGIATWTDEAWDLPGVGAWFERHASEGVPLALFGALPFALDAGFAATLGLEEAPALDARTASVRHSDALIGFERDAPPRIDALGIALANASSDNIVHLGYADAKGARSDAVVSGPWGGYASAPVAAFNGIDDYFHWVVDPFAFLQRALHLEPLPAPDVTTENGRRLWLAHIDGDALPSWAELPGARLGAEEIRDRILARWPWPHTVSVVEGEMVAQRAVADRRQRMFEVARELFRLPFVDIASHSYSHPFLWRELAADPAAKGLSLPIDGYAYDPEREIGGSIDFVRRHLAPPGKPVNVFLWTGDAEPDAAALAASDARGLVNFNGGLTRITRDMPALALVDPMARPVGTGLQVYAPMTNENVYTNEWRGPFDGFRRVIETFELTDRPRRLKPINLYYHFYAGTKAASLRSLEEVYAWSTAQDVHPVHVADYAPKVHAFRGARVARALDGRWTVAGLHAEPDTNTATSAGGVRSVRLLGTARRARLDSDAGLIGQRTLHDATYLHTDGRDVVSFHTVDAERPGASGPYLVSANGTVESWDETGRELRLRVRAHVPVTLELAGIAGCTLRTVAGEIPAQPVPGHPGHRTFRFDTTDTGDARLDCTA